MNRFLEFELKVWRSPGRAFFMIFAILCIDYFIVSGAEPRDPDVDMVMLYMMALFANLGFIAAHILTFLSLRKEGKM